MVLRKYAQNILQRLYRNQSINKKMCNKEQVQETAEHNRKHKGKIIGTNFTENSSFEQEEQI